MRLRSQLILLVALAVVPVVVFSAILAGAFARERERAIEQATRETASALAIAVRREVDGLIASLRTLAESAALDRQDLPAFEAQAERIRQLHAGWKSLILVDSSGRVLLNAAGPLDREISLADRDYFQAAFRERRSVVSDLLVDRIQNRPVIAVAVPAFRGARVRFVLVTHIDPLSLVEPLSAFNLTPGQAFRVFDRQRTTVARFPTDRDAVGTLAGPMFAAIDAGARPEWVSFLSRTGESLYAANVALPEYGWMASLSMPADQVNGPWRTSVVLMVGVGLGLLAISVLAAMTLGRRIERPMSALARQAEAVGHAENIKVRPTGIREIDELGSALATAGRLLRERAEDRTRYEAALAARAEELSEANRLKDEFLATVSHELRSPLNAIVGWTRMLKLGVPGDDAARARALDTIERNARLQEQLIGDLLDVSRIVTGKLRLDARPVALLPIVHSALDVVRPAAEAKGVALEAAFDSPGHTVLGDPDRLQQVLWNLLSNAVRFTPHGGRVMLRIATVSAHAEISVSDNGEGIAPEFLPHVFERFRQADAALTRRHGGLGLGLSIVRHIVELHGGTVRAESEGPGRGSRFTISLPALAVRPAAGEELVRPGPDAVAAHTLDGVRVLVVEDEPDSLELIAVVLARAGASTTQASSAAEAWAALAREPFDVIVCDISMPGEDGYSLMRRIRASDDLRRSRTPAVALTAQTRLEDRTRAILVGFQVHVPKPVETTELVAVVAMLVDRAELLNVQG